MEARRSQGASIHDDVLSLQRSAGNRAVDALVTAATAPSLAPDLPSTVGSALERTRGKPLPSTTRAEMEARFGTDFSDVRVHAYDRAAESARARGAIAYAAGSHIAFDTGRWAPDAAAGRHLLAHELAHVLQQRNAGRRPPALGMASELEADRAAAAVDHGGAARVHSAAPAGAIQCAPPEEESDIRVIPDPSAGKVRVIRVDKKGKIVAGLAELTPAAGEGMDPSRVSTYREDTAKGKPQFTVGAPETWTGTTNPEANVALEKSDEVAFRTDRIGPDDPEAGFNTDEAVTKFMEQYHPEFGPLLLTPSVLLSAREQPDFKRWRKAQVVKERESRRQAQVDRENRSYQMAVYNVSGHMYSPKEAREIYERYNHPTPTAWEQERIAADNLPNEIRDEKDGTLLGYRLTEYREKGLAGGIGVVSEVVLDREGKEVHREETTVLTPATAAAQDLVRGAPITGTIINAAEVGGLSLDLRDPGRFLTEGERIDRAVNAVPFADTARTGIEVATGVSHSDKDIDLLLRDEVRILSDRERMGKAALLTVEIATEAIGVDLAIKPKMKPRPKAGLDMPAVRKPDVPGAPPSQAHPGVVTARPEAPVAAAADATPPARPAVAQTAVREMKQGKSPKAPPARGASVGQKPDAAPAVDTPDNGPLAPVAADPVAKPDGTDLAKPDPPKVSAQTRKNQEALENVEPGTRPVSSIAPEDSPRQPQAQELKREGTYDAPVGPKPPELTLVHDASKQASSSTRASAADPYGGGRSPQADIAGTANPAVAPAGKASVESNALQPGAAPRSPTGSPQAPASTAAVPARAPQALPDVQATSAARVKELQAEIGELDGRIGSLDTQIKKVEGARGRVQRALDKFMEARHAGAKPVASRSTDDLIESLLTPDQMKRFADLRKTAGLQAWEAQEKMLQGLRRRFDDVLVGQGGLQAQRGKLKADRVTAAAQRNEMQGIVNMPPGGGGSHQKVRARTTGGEVNHLPAWDSYKDVIDLKHGEGPAIWMPVEDHRKCLSTGSSDDAIRHRAKQRELIEAGRFDEAVELDLQDIAAKFTDGRYDAYILQMRNYVSRLDPAKMKPRKK